MFLRLSASSTRKKGCDDHHMFSKIKMVTQDDMFANKDSGISFSHARKETTYCTFRVVDDSKGAKPIT